VKFLYHSNIVKAICSNVRYARIGASASVPSIATSFSDTKAKTDPIAIDTTMLISGFVTTLAEKIS
jgi:hypothetical protein